MEKEVQFEADSESAIYHSLTQQPYVGMFVRTEDGRIPIVRQYRPAVEDFTWELPAGTLHSSETAEEAARREVLEETGLESKELVYLGNLYPDTGRLQVDAYAFFVAARNECLQPPAEEGLVVRYVNHAELRQMIISGEFRHSIHLAIYAAVLVRGIQID